MGRLELAHVEDDERWDQFVEGSPQGSLFATSAYLHTLPHGFERRWILKGDEPLAGLYFDRGRQPRSAGQRALIYSGLLFGGFFSRDTQSDRHRRLEATSAIAEWLAEHYDDVVLRLSPHVEDVRGLRWHAYHDPDPRQRFSVTPEYTSYLDIRGFGSDIEGSLKGGARLRRRHWRQGLEAGATTLVQPNLPLLVDGYCQLMERQGSPASPEALASLGAQLSDLIEAGVAAQFTTVVAGEPVYTGVFGWDSKRAYALYCAPLGDEPESFQGTVCHIHAFEWLAKRGVYELDFEGVNSPNRGKFKLSFGGDLRPVFLVTRSVR